MTQAIEKAKEVFRINAHWTDSANEVVNVISNLKPEEIPEYLDYVKNGVKKKLLNVIEKI